MPVNPQDLNVVGDVVVTDPKALRTLAEGGSLLLFDLVRRLGPTTTAQVAAELGLSEAATLERLVALESAGLIDVSEDTPPHWSTPARGIYFEIPERGAEAQLAARSLSGVMLAAASDLPKRWVDQTEPRLDLEWARAAGLFNARVALSADEVRWLQEELERILEPFNNRSTDARPTNSAPVRVLAFFMPEPPSPSN